EQPRRLQHREAVLISAIPLAVHVAEDAIDRLALAEWFCRCTESRGEPIPKADGLSLDQVLLDPGSDRDQRDERSKTKAARGFHPSDQNEARRLAGAEAIDVSLGMELLAVVQPFERVAGQIAIDSPCEHELGAALREQPLTRFHRQDAPGMTSHLVQ